MFINKELKDITKTINELFNKRNFFIKLCSYSNNEINQVIVNLSKIINYYLITKDSKISYTIEELLQKAIELTEINPDILFYPSNSYYINYLKLNGINPYIRINNIPKIDLETLANNVSLFPSQIDYDYSPIYQNIKQAIIESFSCPNILFESILKQPKGQELPLVVGTSETNYYQSILDIRLKNVQEDLQNTSAKIGQKAINSIIGKDSIIVLFPRKTKFYDISDKEINSNLTGEYINPIFLSYIRIPSKYKLLSICASNIQKRNGELLDINTGQEYKLPQPRKEKYPYALYSRYEAVSVNDAFEYTNSEFTGDIDYDIDLIYGQLDSNRSRPKALQNASKNISDIKQRDDITVRKNGRKYEIRNGRHRILYVKHFYESNKASYEKVGRLEELKEYVKIPMNVESSIEDPIANEYLSKIAYFHPSAEIYKVDINNDNPDIVIIMYNKIYHLSNSLDIIEFYNLLEKSQYNNKFLIGENDPRNSKEYQRLFDYLVLILKEKSFYMNLIDIINYLFTNGITINNTHYEIQKLNIGQIATSYMDLQHHIQLKRLFNTKKDLIKSIENKYKMPAIGTKIIEIINENPEYIKLTWDEFYEILIKYEELSSYDSEFLKDAADFAGYQILKLKVLLEDSEYTKSHKI